MKKIALSTFFIMIVVGITQAQSYTSWNITGNSLPTIFVDTYFLGTTKATPLRIRTNNQDRMYISKTGNVGIGTNNPQAKLAVNGEILAKSVRVNTNATYWPDYVFEDSYNLMSLRELERYVNALLLEKVEELTRYVIDLQNQIDELKSGKE